MTLTPFSTKLLAAFFAYRLALVVYWLNILMMGVVLYGSWRYASRAGLIKEDAPVEIRRAIRRRVVIAQSLYAAGALLCIIGTRWSIGFIFGNYILYSLLELANCLYVIRVPIDFPSRESIRSSV